MKKIFAIAIISISLVFSACNTIGGNKNEESVSGNPVTENTEGKVTRINADMFKKLVWDYQKNPSQFVFNGDQPVVIDFYADWCRPCKMVAPIMDELAKEYQGKVRIYKVNTDEEVELARLFNIRSIPAILYVPKTGKPQMSVGMSGKEVYVKTIQDVLLTPDTTKK
jgi:thioredoxin